MSLPRITLEFKAIPGRTATVFVHQIISIANHDDGGALVMLAAGDGPVHVYAVETHNRVLELIDAAEAEAQ